MVHILYAVGYLVPLLSTLPLQFRAAVDSAQTQAWQCSHKTFLMDANLKRSLVFRHPYFFKSNYFKHYFNKILFKKKSIHASYKNKGR